MAFPCCKAHYAIIRYLHDNKTKQMLCVKKKMYEVPCAHKLYNEKQEALYLTNFWLLWLSKTKFGWLVLAKN